jgi:hypothetical protein
MGSTLLPRPDENVFQRRFLVTHNQTPTLDQIEMFSLVILSDATLSRAFCFGHILTKFDLFVQRILPSRRHYQKDREESRQTLISSD